MIKRLAAVLFLFAASAFASDPQTQVVSDADECTITRDTTHLMAAPHITPEKKQRGVIHTTGNGNGNGNDNGNDNGNNGNGKGHGKPTEIVIERAGSSNAD